MKLFGFAKKKKTGAADTTWMPITKQELRKRFQSPQANDSLLIVDGERQPLWYFRTYYYASAWECYEVGRSVSVFADNEKKEIFRESAKNVGDYRYEDTSFGTESGICALIEELPEAIYAVSCNAFEDFVNRNQKASWQHNGMEIHAGSKIQVSRYNDENGAEYPDAAGRTATVLYRFQRQKPVIAFDKAIQDCRIFRNGIHTSTVCGSTTEMPLTDNCSIEKWVPSAGSLS